MRWYPLAALIIVTFAAAHASAQTFTIEQPKSSKRTQTKVIRPGEVSVTPQPKASATHSKSSVKIEEENASPSAARSHAKHSPVKNAKATTKKVATPPPPVETEVAAAPPKRPAPPPLEPVPSINGMSDSQLQQQIESSLHSVPYGSGVHVTVTETEVRLAGTVANGRDKLDATRLAQSYSGNRLFKDDLQIAGSQSAAATATHPAQSGGKNFSATANVDSTPPAATGNNFTHPKD